jgi:hypothetical protein
MKKYILGAVGIAVVVLWKFVVGPSLAVTAQNTLGAGWDDAKPELMAQFSSTFATDWSMFELGQPKIQELADCCATKAVAFLNTTDCSYLYNQTTTTEEEHLKNQEVCMAKVKYDEEEMKFSLECLREHFPEDWKHLKAPLIQGYESSFTSNGVPAAEAKKMATCITDGSVTLANNRKCPVVNKQATTFEDLVNSIDTCIKDPDNDVDFQNVLKSCGAAGGDQS